MIYELGFSNGNKLFPSKIINNLRKFRTLSNVILVKRIVVEVMGNVAQSMYTWNLIRRD